MPRIFCTFCEHEWEEPVDSIWSCPNCEMGAPPTAVVQYSPAEFNDALDRIHSKIISKPVIDRTKVFYSTYGSPRATDYDLLSILFDNIFISEGWGESLNQEDRERLIRYIEADIVRPICLDSFVEVSPDLQKMLKNDWNVIILKEQIGFVQSFPGATASWYINNIAQMISCSDFNAVNHNLAWERFYNLNKDVAGKFYPHAIAHLMNRLNGHGIVASCLGISMIADQAMSNIWKVKLTSFLQRAGIKDNTLGALGEWYCQKVAKVGYRLPIEKVIKFRNNDDARNRFIEFLKKPSPEDVRNNIDYRTHLQSHLGKAIISYNKAFEEKEKFKEVLLSGLLTTFGGLIGGCAGAIIGGVGASVGTFFLRKQELYTAS